MDVFYQILRVSDVDYEFFLSVPEVLYQIQDEDKVRGKIDFAKQSYAR